MKKTISTLFLVALSLILTNCSGDSDNSSDNTDDDTIETPTDPIDPPIDPPTESTTEFHKYHLSNNVKYRLNSIVQLSDSSYTLGGSVTGNKNVLVNFDKYGNIDWTKEMTNTFTPFGIEKLFLNNDGYIGFRGSNYANNTSSHIIYFDGEGNVEDDILFDPSVSSLYNDMIRDGNNFLIGGAAGSNIVYRKLNANGDLIWEASEFFSTEAYSISKLSDGNYISIGGGNITANEDYLVKLSESGEILWTKIHRGFLVSAISNTNFLAVINDDSIYSANIARFDQEGSIIWSIPLVNFRGAGPPPSPLNIISYDDGLFICSYVNEDLGLNLLVFDEDGNEINLHTVDNDFYDYTSVGKTLDNGLIIAYNYEFPFAFGLIKLSNEYLFD